MLLLVIFFVAQQVGGNSQCAVSTHFGALHPCPHATVTWSPEEVAHDNIYNKKLKTLQLELEFIASSSTNAFRYKFQSLIHQTLQQPNIVDLQYHVDNTSILIIFFRYCISVERIRLKKKRFNMFGCSTNTSILQQHTMYKQIDFHQKLYKLLIFMTIHSSVCFSTYAFPVI